MLLWFWILMSGSLGGCLSAQPVVVVNLNAMAMLPCPHTNGNVMWTRYDTNGKLVPVIPIKNEAETKTGPRDERYRVLSNGSLLILNVKRSDSRMYLCNSKRVYLNVTEGNGPTNPPRTHDLDQDPLESDRNRDDVQIPQKSDSWKIPVGVIVGVMLALLGIAAFRFCSRGRMSPPNKTTAEVVYEEIKDGGTGTMMEPDVESPYSWVNMDSTAHGEHLYSVVSKTKDRHNNQSVYSLAQNPLQPLNISP
ncbi:uncharacterized protein LOC115422465 [Sphaeramia orbicularis]|uniref:uncharacterized protein LOC115422465 n=1 Tax=Sphaeramia orbicularis TaxID=375764 RepID=UPI00117CE41F|nr:uncharacterized protein LOC115422465 [Sphaeramia orbicularis]